MTATPRTSLWAQSAVSDGTTATHAPLITIRGTIRRSGRLRLLAMGQRYRGSALDATQRRLDEAEGLRRAPSAKADRSRVTVFAPRGQREEPAPVAHLDDVHREDRVIGRADAPD